MIQTKENQSFIKYLSDEIKGSVIFICIAIWEAINQFLIAIIQLIKIILIWFYRKLSNKIKTFKLPQFNKKEIQKEKSYPVIYTTNIPSYLYNTDNFNIDIEAIELTCNLTIEAYQDTVGGIRNRTYLIFDNLYFLNKISALSNIEHLIQVESTAQKFRNIKELEQLSKLILSTIMKRRMSGGQQYNNNQLASLYTTLDSLYKVDNTALLSERNAIKISNETTKPPVNLSKIFSAIIYGLIFLLAIFYLTLYKWS